MKDTIIVSGGDIQRDFALDFLRNRIERIGREKLCLIAADRGLEFFMENHLLPDVAVGDFDSLSPQGEEFLKVLSTVEVIRLKPEKDDSDTQCAVNLAIRRGTKRIEILGATGRRVDHLIANLGLLILAGQKRVSLALVDQYNYDAGREWKGAGEIQSVRQICIFFCHRRSCEGTLPGRF